MGSSRRCLPGSLEADALSGTELCAYLSVFPSADRVSLPLLAAAVLLFHVFCLHCTYKKISVRVGCECLLETREESSNDVFP